MRWLIWVLTAWQEVYHLLFSSRPDSTMFNPPEMPFSILSTWKILTHLLRPISREVFICRTSVIPKAELVAFSFVSSFQSRIPYQARLQPLICMSTSKLTYDFLKTRSITLFLFGSPMSSRVSGTYQAQNKF